MCRHSYELGAYGGRIYAIAVRVKPDYDDVQEFGVTVYYSTGKGENIDVARIDTDHGGPHLDRLFLEDPDKKFLDPDLEWHEAEKQLSDNWRDYARKYERNRG